MRFTGLILSILLTLQIFTLYAGPARRDPAYLKQPDGTVVKAFLRGDEFTKIRITEDGHAVIQESDGWWCYASYDAQGKRSSSGWKVGMKAPQEVLSSSRNIPYSQLARSASAKRAELQGMADEPVLKRLTAGRATQTKASEETSPVTKHGLVILASFNDVKFKHTREEFENMLTEEGYSVNGATGSAKEYFDDQFKGMMEFDFQVTDIVTLPKTRAYYGANDADGADKAPAEMIRDACRLADDQVDFSLYDDDQDGEVDNVFLIFAGFDEAEGASEECIWSHAWYVYRGAHIELVLDGTRIDRYACASELLLAFDTEGNTHEFISSIGTFCHEYSHTLGLPDFYDVDYEDNGGISAGLWTTTSLMDGGNYNNMGNTPPYYNAIERMIVGLSQPEVLTETGTYTLEPVHLNGKSYMLASEDSEDFFIFECRSNSGWDAYIGGSGMLAYHIDPADGGFPEWLSMNEVNIDPEHQHADLLEADGRNDGFSSTEDFYAGRKNIRGIFFPYNDIDAIDSESAPGLVFWNGSRSDCSLTSIRREGNSIRFTFLSNDNTALPPSAVNITKDVFADAAIIGFESSYPYEGEATVSWGRSGGERNTVMVAPYSPGKYAIVLEGLESSGKTYEASISFTLNGIESESRSVSVMTKRMPSVKWPYIYLGSMERNTDGSFMPGSKCPLRVYGATGAVEVRWEFNGKSITHDGDGYFRFQTGGELQATVFWEDGSTDKIIKEIRLSSE